MQLTERQQDALTELINIGFARAGASLSDLTGRRIILEVPRVAMHPVKDLGKALSALITTEVATVHQIFMGPVAGDALLMLNYDGAVMLNHLLTDEPTLATRLDASAREVLTEVGNILLNACLGTFGNLLHVKVSYSLPELHLETLHTVLRTLLSGKDDLRYALVVHTGFQVRASDIKGYLVIVLGIASLARLIEEVDKWEEGQEN